jgi:hypothetical protein
VALSYDVSLVLGAQRGIAWLYRTADRRNRLAVCPAGCTGADGLCGGGCDGVLLWCVPLGPRRSTLLPERSKLFKSHWSNQWLTSKIELK